jgi:hypothetical protein
MRGLDLGWRGFFKALHLSFKSCLIALALALPASVPDATQSYPIVGAGQTKCYYNTRKISCPKPGQRSDRVKRQPEFDMQLAKWEYAA